MILAFPITSVLVDRRTFASLLTFGEISILLLQEGWLGEGLLRSISRLLESSLKTVLAYHIKRPKSFNLCLVTFALSLM